MSSTTEYTHGARHPASPGLRPDDHSSHGARRRAKGAFSTAGGNRPLWGSICPMLVDQSARKAGATHMLPVLRSSRNFFLDHQPLKL